MAKQQKTDQQNSQQSSQQSGQPNEQQELLLARLSETAGLLKQATEQNQQLQQRLEQLEKVKDDQKTEDEDAASIQALINKLDSSDDEPVRKSKTKNADIDSLTPRQLLDVVADVMDEAMGTHLTKLEARILKQVDASQDGFLKKLDGTQKVLGQVIGHLGIAEAKGKYRDWDSVSDEVKQQMAKVPGLSLDEAYLLVKARKHEDVIPADLVESERPDRSATRSLLSDDIPSLRNRRKAVDTEDEDRSEQNQRRSSGIGDLRQRIQMAADKALAQRRM